MCDEMGGVMQLDWVRGKPEEITRVDKVEREKREENGDR